MARKAKRITPRRGRPPLARDKGKRAVLNARVTKKIRQRLETSASARGRSLSQEIEFRLERSFGEDDARISEFGDKLTYRVMKLLALAKEWVEDDTGKEMKNDWETLFGVLQAWERLLLQLGPKPPDGWFEQHEPPTPVGLLASEEEQAAYKEALADWKPIPQLGKVVADHMVARLREWPKKTSSGTTKGKGG